VRSGGSVHLGACVGAVCGGAACGRARFDAVYEKEIEIVYNMYRMRRFTTITVCAGCCLWALPTMPYMKLTSQF
jgi:hypothetical protein